jgi:hypothetical protein
MADKKKYVEVECDIKDKSFKGIKPDALIKALVKSISDAINNKSKGKLTTKDKSADGFALNVDVVTLKVDNANNPTKLTGKLDAMAMPLGSTTKSFKGSANGSLTDLSKDPEDDAEALVKSLANKFIAAAIDAMLKI